MSNKYNSAFLNAYIELDKICCHKFGIVTGGITEYVNRLINARYAPEREEVLPRLVRYRNIRNRIAHEAGALQNIDELNKSDIRWLTEFIRDVEKRRDPISMYLRKARRYAKRRKARKRMYAIFAALVTVGIAVGAYFIFFR